MVSPRLRYTAVSTIGVIGTSGVEFTTENLCPAPEYADRVARFWALRWAVRPGREQQASAVSLLLPDPLVVLNGERVSCQGIMRGCRATKVPRTGTLYAAALRPGVVSPLVGGATAALNDRKVPVADTAWGARTPQLAADLRTAAAGDGLPGFAAAFERSLRTAPRLPEDPDLARVGAMVDAIRDDGLTRVVELVDRFHLSARTIQRGFNRHLGVSPKWLLRRYRVLRGAYRLQYDPPQKASELATSLGYFDDSHFARDFADMLGSTPAAFAQRLRSPELTGRQGRQALCAPAAVGA
ncbi:helix-turn-helix domain-containing protein [Yinghuangia sp. ASG 101]|uniref:helix-turn-helix domain-containing protein n=1 Tax=Yinghuangia sp. ASG 101 TaxID=2896848 RepID=UPI001E552F3B|nr:helix-turn-helix domain-containing protein [Yinghuangia sp. ASG 101]UGQ12305.1 helix-turn-helix domain-containing protein [Yinghuangia sp. ASG 101]